MFAPPPSCGIVAEASETVCGIHTVSFGLPDASGGSTCCPCFFSFQTGAACAAPISLRFVSFPTGAAFAAPVSFYFQQGQHLLPPFLFVLSWDSTCCPRSFPFERGQRLLLPFLFISNGGSTCCPCFSSFRMGAALAAPLSFSSERGRRVSHALPPFLSVSIGGTVYPTRYPPFSFGFDRGQRETQARPPFLVLYPPITGGICFN